MRYRFLVMVVICLGFILSRREYIYPQVKEEKEEKVLEVQRLRRRPPAYKLSQRAGLFFGYDSNVNLGTFRKGDIFEEFLYSVDFIKPWIGDIKFTFDYDLDVLNYNEYIKVSNILNHLRFGFHKKFSPFRAGGGYDLSIFYYPHNNQGDFLFHKGFLYFRQDISRKIYHKLQLLYGIKDYLERKAMGDTITALQDKERLDRRWSVEYSLTYFFDRRLLLRYRTKFSINDSNARYVDFYDYKSYKQSLGLDYRIKRDLYLISNFIYIRKNYKSRTVTLRDYREKDNLYAATLGLLYRLNEDNSLSLYYTYRENSSNDSLQEYSGSVITVGWQYYF